MSESKVSDNYSIENFIKAAFDFELKNMIKVDPKFNDDPVKQIVAEYMEKRIKAITEKFK